MGYELKQPTNIDEQINILKTSKNLIVDDEEWAKEVLLHINYYRFSAYMLAFKDGTSDMVKPGTTFNDIYTTYTFDKEFRSIMRLLLESVEITFRRHIAYVTAHYAGSLAHEDVRIFVNGERHEQFLRSLTECIDRSKELFVEHHKERYGGKFPVWVALELTMFSDLSKMYSNLQDPIRKDIAACTGIPEKYIPSWLQALCVFRNMCAHHGRIYNRKSHIKAKLTRPAIKAGLDDFSTGYAFYAIYICRQLLPRWMSDSIMAQLDDLFRRYEGTQVRISLLGFPSAWRELLDMNAPNVSDEDSQAV